MGLACGDHRVPDAGHGCDPKKEEPSMSKKGKSIIDFNGQPVAPKDYHPVWLNSLADDVTLEGSAMNGFVQGPEAVLSIVAFIRTLYERQEFNFAGPYGENSFLEDYTAWVHGEPIGNVVLVARNAAGQAQHIVANYRPRSTLLSLSRLRRAFRGHSLRRALRHERGLNEHGPGHRKRRRSRVRGHPLSIVEGCAFSGRSSRVYLLPRRARRLTT
jgi:hypothetical protein